MERSRPIRSDSLFGGDNNEMLQGGIGDDTIADFVGGGDDRVDLLGGLSVSDDLGTSTVLLAGGCSIFASNSYLWQATDFI